MSAVAPQPRVVLVDAVPMSAIVAAVPDPRAVVVAVHGGATSSAYFDCPGNPGLSLLRAAAERGFTAIALDRPGYGASALYQDEMGDPQRRVELAYGALDRILADTGHGAGIFLFAHSAGCELALRMAVRDDAPVIGLELAGTGLRYRPDAWEVIKQATVTARPVGLRDLLWQPTDLYPPDVLTGALSAPGVAYESRVTAHWPRRDFPELAGRVTVPVEYTAGEHESVWETTPEALTQIAELFKAAPRVAIHHMADSGHNLSVGLTAGAYHRHVLSFIDECVADSDARSTNLEAG